MRNLVLIICSILLYNLTGCTDNDATKPAQPIKEKTEKNTNFQIYADRIILIGVYKGKNLFVQSPYSDNGQFCVTYEPIVNGYQSTGVINSSAFEIKLDKFHLKIGDKVEIIIKHHLDCKPKILNPEAILPAMANKNILMDLMIDFSLEITSEYLDFTFENTSTDLNSLLKSGKANCVGYSVVFNAILNYLLDKTKTETILDFTTEHVVGQISVNGININELFTDPFFKDHDFIIIDYLKSNERIGVDPSLYEYFGIKRVVI